MATLHLNRNSTVVVYSQHVLKNKKYIEGRISMRQLGSELFPRDVLRYVGLPLSQEAIKRLSRVQFESVLPLKTSNSENK